MPAEPCDPLPPVTDDPALAGNRRPLAWSSAVKLLGMFLFILGAKFWVVQMCSGPLPMYDQWEVEGTRLLQPFLHGQLHLRDLFAPWIQHRIAWTRLLALGLFWLNGQWDTQVETIEAACLHAGTALLLGAILVRRMGRACEDAILLGLLLIFALPIAVENTLSGGFNSQYYTLLLFAVVTLWGMGSHRPGSAGWWLGAGGAVAAWFSVATGPLPALAVAAWMALRLMRRDGVSRDNGITLATALLLGMAGLSLYVGVDQHDELRAHSVVELLIRYMGLLGWPLLTPWAAPLIYAPLVWFVWRTLHGRRPIGPAGTFLLPLGIFTLLHTAALAYGRANYFGLYVSRYMDFLSFGPLVNFLCLVLLFRETSAPGAAARVRLPLGLLTVIWAAGTGYGLIHLTTRTVAETLPLARTMIQREVENVSAWVARPASQRRPGENVAITMCNDLPISGGLLRDDKILAILPALVRAPVVLEAAAASASVHRVQPFADNDMKSGWALEGVRGTQPVYFRSQTINGLGLPYLRFPEVSDLGSDAFLALVDERTGAATWLQPGTLRAGRQSILVKTPDGPFHVEAVIAAGSDRRVEFSYPRAVGRLSAWVDPVLNSNAWLLSAGCALWLGAVFWRRLGLHELGFGVGFAPFRVPAWNWRNRRMTIRHG